MAIVTGGAGDIGSVYAEALCSAGASVVIADLNLEASTAVADTLNAEGFRAAGLQVDVRSEASTAKMAASAIEHFGGIDILINNRGDHDRPPALRTDQHARRRVGSGAQRQSAGTAPVHPGRH